MTDGPLPTKDRPGRVRMAQITAGEARALYPRKPVVLLPMGSHEDQGPHAPMGDFLSADRVAELMAIRACEQGTETVIAPVLPFGGMDYFGSMPGGIALSQASLRGVLTDMLACLLRHGLTRIVVINGHGGNVQAIHETTHAVYRSQNVIIPSLYLWSISYALLPGILGAEQAKASSGHGADPLTSVVLHLFPDLIRKDLVPDPVTPGKIMGLDVKSMALASFEGMPVTLPVEYDAMVPNAVYPGDARLSSADTGAKLVEELVSRGAAFLKHYAAQT